MPSPGTRTRSDSSKSKQARAASVTRGKAKKSAKDDSEKGPRIAPPSPPRLAIVRLVYEPPIATVYYPDKVQIVSMSCSQPVIPRDYPQSFRVDFTMEVRNLTPEVLRNVECRMYIRENWTIAVEHVTLQGNATITVRGRLGTHLDGGYTVSGTVSPGVVESFLGRFNNYMTREFDITHTSSRPRPANSTLPRVYFQ